MSVYVMGHVKKDYVRERYGDHATPLRKLLLLCLADEANDEGSSSYPGIRRLAEEALCSVGAVRENTAALEAAGLIVVLRPKRQGRGHYNRYGIVMGRDRFDVFDLVLGEAIGKGASADTFSYPQWYVDNCPGSVDKPPLNARKGYTGPPLTRGKGTPQTAHTQDPLTQLDIKEGPPGVDNFSVLPITQEAVEAAKIGFAAARAEIIRQRKQT